MDVDALFRERLKRFSVEFVRYAQYMANGGVLFLAIFLFGLLAFYYRSLIEMIPPWLPIPYFLAFVIAVLVTRSPHRTFLREADLLFLTPQETRMAGYFRKTQIYNFVIQSVGLFVVMLLLAPLYQGVTSPGEVQLWLYWCMPFLLKGWNVYSSWIFLRLPDQKKRWVYALARFFFSFLVLAWVWSEGRFLAYRQVPSGGMVCMLLLIWLHIRLQTIRKRHSYPWYRLLEVENGLLSRFYRIVNHLRDVPSLRQQVKRRAWIHWVTRVIPYRQSNAGRLLFLHMFIRSGELAGMYVRLVVLSSVLVAILPHPYAKGIVALLMLLMTGSQLKGLWAYHRHRHRLFLLPIDERQQKRSYLWVRRGLLVVQGVVNAAAGLLWF